MSIIGLTNNGAYYLLLLLHGGQFLTESVVAVLLLGMDMYLL